MSAATAPPRGMRATVVAPFHYHSLAVPGGTATQATFLTDRQVAFALGAALGCLSRSQALPERDYPTHLRALPFAASLFETDEPRLLRPIARRLNLDDEAGLTIAVQNATSTGNLKTYFSIQEVAPGGVYRGATFGADPFALASEAEGREVRRIVVRTGRHLGGLIVVEPDPDVAEVRLNAHTASMLGDGRKVGTEAYVLHDLQATPRMPLATAADIVAAWGVGGGARA